MDPLSIIASSVTIIDLTQKIIACCTTYINTIKDAPSDLRKIKAEVTDLQAVVRLLDLLTCSDARGKTQSSALVSLQKPGGTFASCERTLAVLLDLLKSNPSDPQARDAVRQWLSQVKLANLGFSSAVIAQRRNKEAWEPVSREQLEWSSKKMKIRALLDEVSQYKASMSLALAGDSKHIVSRVSTDVSKVNDVDQVYKLMDFITWLEVPNFISNHSRASGLRCPGTCIWVFEQPEYKQWLEKGGILWLSGTAGSGKTLISSAVIQQLQLHWNYKKPETPCVKYEDLKKQKAVVFFYFDFEDSTKQTLEGFLAAIVSQIITKLNISWDLLSGLIDCSEQKSHQPPTLRYIRDTACKLVKAVRPTIVIDALDDSYNVSSVLSIIRQLQSQGADIFFTSRPRRNISSSVDYEITVTPSKNSQDMVRFVSDTVNTLVAAEELWYADDALQDEIIHQLSSNSNGVFQWTTSQLKSLPRIPSAQAMSRTLMRLPQGLTNMYQSTLDQIEDEESRDFPLVTRAFGWVAFAQRPLSLEELCVAVASSGAVRELHKDNVPHPMKLLALGGSLLICNPDTSIVSLAHSTVKEYLTGQTDGHRHTISLSEPDCHLELSKTCLSYLQLPTTREELTRLCRLGERPSASMAHTTRRNPDNAVDLTALLSYAGWFWETHCTKGGKAAQDVLFRPLYVFFFGPTRAFPEWQELFHSGQPLSSPKQESPSSSQMAKYSKSARDSEGIRRGRSPPRSMPAINNRQGQQDPSFHHTEERGVNHRSKEVPPDNASAPSTDAVKGRQRAPTLVAMDIPEIQRLPFQALHYLAQLNMPALIEIGLEKFSEDPYQAGGWLNTTPVHEAVRFSSKAACKVLLAAGPVDKTDDYGRTPLFYACQTGNEAIAQMLLSHGASIRQPDWYKQNPLHVAINCGHTAVAGLILEERLCDINAVDAAKDTPLSIACRKCHRMVPALLKKKAKPTIQALRACSAPDKSGYPLEKLVRESEYIYEDLFRDIADGPFDAAAEKVADMFLASGYVLDKKGKEGYTALELALKAKNLDFARYLFRHGAKFDFPPESRYHDVVQKYGKVDLDDMVQFAFLAVQKEEERKKKEKEEKEEKEKEKLREREKEREKIRREIEQERERARELEKQRDKYRGRENAQAERRRERSRERVSNDPRQAARSQERRITEDTRRDRSVDRRDAERRDDRNQNRSIIEDRRRDRSVDRRDAERRDDRSQNRSIIEDRRRDASRDRRIGERDRSAERGAGKVYEDRGQEQRGRSRIIT